MHRKKRLSLHALPMESSLSNICLFISRFIREEKRLREQYVEIEKQSIRQLVLGISPLAAAWKYERQQQALGFNVFDIMRYGHYETRLHTPFLVNLLDPAGTHQQGDLFLRAFLQRFLPVNLDATQVEQLRVVEELNIKENGRIDIYLSFIYQGLFHQVALENKINHTDGDRQLERYYSHLLLQGKKEHCYLFYLNRFGTPPRLRTEIVGGVSLSASINHECYVDLVQKKRFVTISYRTGISEWLCECIAKRLPPRLTITLQQYMEIIKTM